MTTSSSSEQTLPTPTEESTTDESSGMSMSRIVKLATGATIATILLLLVVALVAALTAAETWAPVIQIFRDVLMVVFIMQGILVIGATAILILQIARFVVMLQTEIKPILDNARETTNATKATAQFVSKNASDPLIQIKSFFAGLTTFIRELLRIRSVIKPRK